MKNTGLIALVALGVMLLVAVKFNLMPNLKTSLYDEDGYVDSLETKHENGVQKDYYQNGNIKTETPYKNNKIDSCSDKFKTYCCDKNGFYKTQHSFSGVEIESCLYYIVVFKVYFLT